MDNVRNINSFLPTADADFLMHVLKAFQRVKLTVIADNVTLDVPTLVKQIQGKLYKKGVPYKVSELYVMYEALCLYLNVMADREGKKDIAERLFFTLEENLDPFLN